MFEVITRIQYRAYDITIDCHFSTLKCIHKCYFRIQMESSGARRGLTKKLVSMSGVEDIGDTVNLAVTSNLFRKW